MKIGAVILFICVLVFVLFEVIMLIRDIVKKKKAKKQKAGGNPAPPVETEDSVKEGKE